MTYLRTIIIILGICVSSVASAYNIKGTVVDRLSSGNLEGSAITLLSDSTTVVAQTFTDAKGRFSFANCTLKNVIIDARLVGYYGERTLVTGFEGELLDLGTIGLMPSDKTTLGEVTVTAKGVVQKTDRYLVFPSSSEVDRSASSINLLSSMQNRLPGLRVNESLRTVTIDNSAPVLQINGKEADVYKVLAINNNDILRIEYSNNPDIRYANRGTPGIINFILKPRRQGGSVMIEGNSALTTGMANSYESASYYVKNSEWNITHSLNMRNYSKRELSEHTELIGRKDGTVVRENIPIPSGMYYAINDLNLGYTLVPDQQTTFSVEAHGSFSNSQHDPRYYQRQKVNGQTSQYMYHKRDKEYSFSPNINAFFRKNLKSKQSIEMIAYYSGADGYNDRNVENIYDDPTTPDYELFTHNNNSSWRVGGEAVYGKEFKAVTFKVGASYFHNRAKNDYRENGGNLVLNRLRNDNLYAYTSAVGSLQRFGYSVGLGMQYYRAADTENNTMNAWRPKINVTLNYRFNNTWSLNYLFIYSPSMPSLSQQSDIVQTVDSLIMSRGNIGLKPSVWFRNRMFVRASHRKFVGSLWFSHSRTVNSIFNDYVYINDRTSPYYNKFLSTTVNGRHDDHINVELDLGLNQIANLFSVQLEMGWDWYRADLRFDTYTDRSFYAGVRAQLYWRNFMLSSWFEIRPQYSLSGNTMERAQRWNYINVSYKWRNWYFTAGIANPFTRRGWVYTSKTFSQVAPSNRQVLIKDNRNMVTLGITYRCNFGKPLQKQQQTLKATSLDRGM